MKIKICISTCKDYSSQTIPLLLSTLEKSNVNLQDVYVFEGGHNKEEMQDKVYKHFFVPHNSFDFTSLIEITEKHIESDYWLLLHDTCKVGENFNEKLNSVALDKDKISLIPHPSMNIGLYRYHYLLKHKAIINILKNTDVS